MEVFEWWSYSCNNSSDYRLVAKFDSPKTASARAKELAAMLEAHAAEFDRIDERPGAPTKVLRTYGAKYKHKLSGEPLIWGEEGLADDPPEVGVVGDTVVLYHGYCSGGFGPDLPAILKKAGAVLPADGAEDGPLVLFAELTLPAAADALEQELRQYFEQRHDQDELSEWTDQPWDGDGEQQGKSVNVGFYIDGKRCAFTLPISPKNVAGLQAYLKKRGVKKSVLRIASVDDIKAVQTHEDAMKKAPAPAVGEPSGGVALVDKLQPAIPRTPPRITAVKKAGTLEDRQTPYGITAFGDAIVMATGSNFFRSTDDGKTFTRLNHPEQTGIKAIAVDAGSERAWACAYGYVVSTEDGFQSIQRHEVTDREQYYAIAKTADGVWIGGHPGKLYLSIDGKSFTHVAGAGKSDIYGLVPTPFGVLVCRYNGQVQLATIKKGKPKLEPVPLRVDHAWGGCVTASGAIVLGGERKGGRRGAVFRSLDGKTWSETDVPASGSVYTITSLPDGRLIAGAADDTLLVSYDDGRSFELLEHSLGEDRPFSISFAHKGAVYVSHMLQKLLRIE